MLVAAAAGEELSRPCRQLRGAGELRVEVREQLLGAELERDVVARGGIEQAREEIGAAQQRLVREQEIAAGAGALLREDEPGGEEAREGAAILVHGVANAALGKLAPAQRAHRSEIDDSGRRAPPRLSPLVVGPRHAHRPRSKAD